MFTYIFETKSNISNGLQSDDVSTMPEDLVRDDDEEFLRTVRQAQRAYL